MGEVRKHAVLSPCGLYRYRLTRHWNADVPPLVFVMLNPSTADATVDDPTIRRCISFAQREGAGGIAVVNLYAFRATDPKALATQRDPHGPGNGAALWEVAAESEATGRPLVCAWGARSGHYGTATATRLKGFGATLRCLGKTKHGHPKHPLYVPGDAPLVPFP